MIAFEDGFLMDGPAFMSFAAHIQTLSIEQLMLLRDHHVNSIDQIIVLLVLYDAYRSRKAVRLSDLHTLSTQSKSSFFRMIKKLEDEQGLIRTDTNFDDQRSKWVRLTDEAVQMIEEVTQSSYATSLNCRQVI